VINTLILYGFPLIFDIIVSTTLFVGRHGLASQGYGESTVGSIVLGYGVGYVISCLLMPRIIKPHRAKGQMLGALAGVIAICLILANAQRLLLIQALYCLFPFLTSLLFNAFQIYMLGISNQNARPLAMTAGHFTLAWSIGYALGPFASSALKNALEWSQIYYLVALLTGLVSIVLYAFKPQRSSTQAQSMQTAGAQNGNGRSLVGPAWLGLLFGWTVLNAVLVYWPVQAVQLGIPAGQRGWVEFAYALMQGISALLLTYVPRWHYKPAWLLILGGSGVAALGVFGLSAHTLLFVVGAVLYGTFTGGMFSYMVYHSMVEEDKAVRRVAMNETFVGITYLAASPVATLLHKEGTPFGPSYLFLDIILIVGVLGQTLFAYSLLKRDTPQPVEVG
jgi:MFS family permease